MIFFLLNGKLFLSLEKQDLAYCLVESHAMPDDEVDAGTGRAPGHPEVAVDQDLPSRPQGRVNEVNNVIHMFFDICLVNIH